MLNRKKKKICLMKGRNLFRYLCKIKSLRKNKRLICKNKRLTKKLWINLESKRDIKYLNLFIYYIDWLTSLIESNFVAIIFEKEK